LGFAGQLINLCAAPRCVEVQRRAKCHIKYMTFDTRIAAQVAR
jgi:hypothetical protein